MTRAAFTLFFNPDPRIDEHYRTYWEFWKKLFLRWKDEIDKLYILSVYHPFTEEDHRWLKDNKVDYVILNANNQAWQNINMYIFRINEDLILSLDQDTYIYKPGFVDSVFKKAELEGCELVAAFREGNDGNVPFWEAVHKRFPYLKENKLGEMATYMFMVKRDLLRQIPEIDFSPDFVHDKTQTLNQPIEIGTYLPEIDYKVVEPIRCETSGLAGIKLLDKSKKTHFLKDDLTSVYIDNTEVVEDKRHGWYHQREFFRGLQIINSGQVDENKTLQEFYQDFVRNKHIHFIRSLAWTWIMDEVNGMLPEFREKNLKPILDSGYTEEEWLLYIEKIKKCHPWLKNLKPS